MGCMDIASGEVISFATDFELPGYISLEFERTYRSSCTYDGPLGRGWIYKYDQLLRVEATRIVYRDEELREIVFDPIEVGQTAYNAQDALTLKRRAPVEYVLVTHNQQVLIFTSAGSDRKSLRLSRVEDLNENALQFIYQNGLLHRILDSVGRDIVFSYTIQHRISEVRLLSTELAEGFALLVRYEYNPQGDLVTVIDSLGNAFHFAYDDHLLVQFKNRNGHSCYFQYDGKRRCVRTWRDERTMLREVLFDEVRKANLVYNSLGYGSAYRYNAAGLVTEEINPLGDAVQTLFNKNLDPIVSIDADGLPLESLIEFDDRKNPLSEMDPGGGITRYEYNALNQLTRLEDAEGAVWEWTYDARGNLLHSRSPEGSEWKYETDTRGLITKITQPNGRILHITRSPDRRFHTLADEFGVILRQEYDLFGNPVSITDGGSHTQRFSYNSAGHLLSIENPDGGIQRWRYDGEGNPIHYTSQSGTEMRLEYDGWALARARIYPSGHSVRYLYDSEDELMEVINQNGEHHTFTANALGRCIAQRFFDGRVETYEYNARGDLIASYDAAGQGVTMNYDANSNLIQKNYPDGSELLLSYDAIGRIKNAQLGNTSISYEYDGHSNVLKEMQNGRLLEYDYDAMNNRMHLRIDGARERTYVYDRRDRLSSIEDNGTRHEFEYDGLNRVIEHRMPGGIRKRLTYGFWNRAFEEEVLAKNGLPIVHRRFEQDVEGRLIQVDDSIRGLTRYCYTAIGQIQTVQHKLSPIEQYAYDPSGNLISVPDYPRLEYDSGNRLVKAGDVRFGYDQSGNICRRYDGRNVTHYHYDGDGQLHEVILPSGSIIHYSYDALGRRVLKSSDTATTRYLWDDDSLMEEAIDGHTPIEYLFEPETFFPLAQTVDRQLILCNANDLGTPTELIDLLGTLLWSPTYRAFGTVMNEGVGKKSPFRFAGQYQDSDTGLYYNWFRYYAPEFGRYTSFDPMGLDAGLNGYQYTLNPINWIDPFGLSAKIASLPPYMEKARRRGVARMWAVERDLLRAGDVGSRNWTDAEQAIIRAGQSPPGWEGHHKKSVKHYYARCKKIKDMCKKKQKELRAKCREEARRLAESKGNLQPLRTGQSRAGRSGMKERNEHLAAHRGNFCSATHGRFDAGW
jgi:RHS repeat-associated protein